MIDKYIGRTVIIIYQDRKGNFTRRTIGVHSVCAGKVKAFDVEKHAFRIFDEMRIMAVLPVTKPA